MLHVLQVKAGLDAILESVSRALEAGLGLDYGTVTTEEVRRHSSELDIGTVVKHRTSTTCPSSSSSSLAPSRPSETLLYVCACLLR